MQEFQLTVTILGILLLVLLSVSVSRMSNAVGRLDRLVNLLVKQSGIDPQEIAMREAAALARQGKKIEAIRVYRELTGVGLAEAKAAVERMQNG